MRVAIMTALAVTAAGGVTASATAQGLGGEVNSCLLKDRGSFELGRFDSVAEALAAAKARSGGSGRYAIAKLDSGRVAIDSSGVPHPISEDLCVGDSGPEMKKPEVNGD